MSSDRDFIHLRREILRADWYREATPFTRALLLLLAELANTTTRTTSRGETILPGQLLTSWSALARRMSWVENGRLVVPGVKKVRLAAAVLREAGILDWTATGTRAGDGLLVTLRTHEVTGDATEEAARTPAVIAATTQYEDQAHSIDRPGPQPRPGRACVGQRERLGLPQGEERRHRGDGDSETGAAPEGGAAPPEPETLPPRGGALGLDLAALRALLRTRRTPR